MSSELAPDTTSPAPLYIRGAGEVVLFCLVALSPWPFASNDPPFESALSAGVLLLTALWAGSTALTGRFAVRCDIVTVCLGGLALWSAAQLVPLPEPVVGLLSPTRLEWHRALNPAEGELLPGEAVAPVRPALPLTVDPAATRTFLARVLAVLLVYLAARNWLATTAGFRRLAWVSVANGAALAALALAQFFSAPPNVVYWSLRCEGAVFGPFVCRNHYPDFAAVCMGLVTGLLLSNRTRRGTPGLLTPSGVGLIAVLGLIGTSVAFSLSRGGIFAAGAAAVGACALSCVGRARGPGHWFGPAALGAAALVALGLFGWLGTGAIERRMATLGSTDTADTRGGLWRDAVKLVPPFWAAGTGGGTFVWVEPLARTGRPEAVVEFAHNEYLEAAVEGGVVRLALTVALAVGVAVAVGRGARRRRDRSDGPLLLGAWFGLAAVGLHAAAEFAVHMPAVALLVATVAGYAVAASDARTEEAAPARGRGWAVGASLVVAGLAVFVALDARSRERAHRLKAAADRAYQEWSAPDRLARRAEFLDARVAYRSDDPAVLFEAAQGHLDAAVEATLAGMPPGAEPPGRFPPGVVERHLVPALRLLRAARAANPVAPKPHTRLGLFAEYFARSEPAAAHFDRAKRLLPQDPALWYSSGREALRRGELEAAWADWRRSLALSNRYLPAVLTAARQELTPAEVIERVLPAEPVVLLAAADRLYPDAGAHEERRPFLEAAVAADAPDAGAGQLAAVARACDELGDGEGTLRAWRRAVDRAPDSVEVRGGYGRWLERQERYEEAIAELEWVQGKSPSAAVRDRLDAARHGLKLKTGIGSK